MDAQVLTYLKRVLLSGVADVGRTKSSDHDENGRWAKKDSSKSSGGSPSSKVSEWQSKAGSETAQDKTLSGIAAPLQQRYDADREHGMRVAEQVMGVADKMGCDLAGIEFCLKGGGSLSDKIGREIADGKENGIDLTPEEAYDSLNDVVRFTILAAKDNVVNTFKDFVKTQQKNGHTLMKVKNTWVDSEGKSFRNNYHGLHIIMRDPDGTPYETQIHTAASYDAKEHGTHKDYELWRSKDPKITQEEKDLANERMCKIWDKIEPPKDIATIKNFKKGN